MDSLKSLPPEVDTKPSGGACMVDTKPSEGWHLAVHVAAGTSDGVSDRYQMGVGWVSDGCQIDGWHLAVHVAAGAKGLALALG